MDQIQRTLIKAGHKELAQEYYKKIAAWKIEKTAYNNVEGLRLQVEQTLRQFIKTDEIKKPSDNLKKIATNDTKKIANEMKKADINFTSTGVGDVHLSGTQANDIKAFVTGDILEFPRDIKNRDEWFEKAMKIAKKFGYKRSKFD